MPPSSSPRLRWRVSAPATGFGHDTNTVTILDPEGVVADVPTSSKRVVADAILDAVVGCRGT